MSTTSKNGYKARRIDFQAFRKEYREQLEPVVIVIAEGVEVEFPPQMPATVMLDIMAWMEEAGRDADLADIPVERAVGIFNDLLGADRFKTIVREHELDLTELFWVLEALMTQYMSDVPEPEPGKPATGKRSTSSKTGR